MTIAFALPCDEGMVLCCDLQGSAWAFYDDKTVKMFPLWGVEDASHYVMIAGDVGVASFLVGELQRRLAEDSPIETGDMPGCARLLSKIAHTYYAASYGADADWAPATGIPDVAFLLVGYNRQELFEAHTRDHVTQLSSVDKFIPRGNNYLPLVIGMRFVADYYLPKIYHRKHSLEAQKRLAAFLVVQTQQSMPGVSARFFMTVLRPDGTCQEVGPEELRRLSEWAQGVAKGSTAHLWRAIKDGVLPP